MAVFSAQPSKKITEHRNPVLYNVLCLLRQVEIYGTF